MSGRLLDYTIGDPYQNLALEEALFRTAKVPLLRVWDNQRSVVLGRAQLAEAETDLDYCLGAGIPVVRRFTAGGTVYNGPGNTNWSFVVPKQSSEGPLVYAGDAKGVFIAFAHIVVDALRSCSLDAAFEEPNRIVDGEGLKISGMAAYVSSATVLCHGTLLMHADLGEAERVTTAPRHGIPAKYPRSRHARIANCMADRGGFVRELAKASGVPADSGVPDHAETEMAGRLLERKYSRREWNLGDPFGLDYS